MSITAYDHPDPMHMTRTELGQRIDQLLNWPGTFAEALGIDPRCDHGPDCPYNSTIELERAWTVAS